MHIVANFTICFNCAGEILLSISGLEFAYSQAPKIMNSNIMSLFFLTIFLGNIIVAIINQLNIFSGGAFFMFFEV